MSVCLSVCLSVGRCVSLSQCWYCDKTIVYIVKLVTSSGRAMILVLYDPIAHTPLQRTLSTDTLTAGIGKISIFDKNRRLFRKQYEIGLDTSVVADSLNSRRIFVSRKSAEKIPARRNRRQKCSAEYPPEKKIKNLLSNMTDVIMTSDILIIRLTRSSADADKPHLEVSQGHQT